MNAPMKKNAEADATPLAAPKPVTAVPPAAEAAEVAAAPKKKGRLRRNLLMFGLPLVLAGGGAYFYLNGGRFVDTDNAYVQQVKVSLSADVAGRVTEVDVAENQVVAADDVLFKIDPEPYRIAMDQAEAALASARVNVEQLRVGYGTAQAKLTAAQQTLDLRQSEFDRQQASVTQGVSATASLDAVKLSLQDAKSDVALAQQDLASTVAALAGNPNIETDMHPAVRTAIAARESAARDLAKTTVVAPAAGVISQMASLNVGQFVSTGTTIASLIKSTDTWVEANFKETQLDGLKQGLPVEVTVDAYPGLSLHGSVDSIGAATGSQFALIPAQNATGNWVKVTQRITVRVKLDDQNDAELLRAGMSAVVAVDTGKTVLDKLL
ncbi:MAG: Membrane fusion component of tripartite multidrug resistance system [Devosia sp.]|uniref:HlyD family secretion protein n=1 Tax=Devosia sp. TaxID=1871048 RepID=UPI0026358FB9|nr:HlyD family secretion protein [Devosia sp.]MDB5528664.1 Membrane fusion component of tripartite multidrug resistance system [Devosia sp.]